jgi:hypothetical protein
MTSAFFKKDLLKLGYRFSFAKKERAGCNPLFQSTRQLAAKRVCGRVPWQGPSALGLYPFHLRLRKAAFLFQSRECPREVVKDALVCRAGLWAKRKAPV